MVLEALILLAPLVELEWDAPDSCPSPVAFEESVRTQADVTTEQDGPAVLKASVVIRELGAQQWELLLSMEREGEAEERRFEAETCEAVAEVAATLVSLRVVEWVESSPLVPEPDVSLSGEPKSTPAPEPAEPVDPSRSEPSVAVPSRAVSPGLRTDRPPLALGGWLSILGGLAFGVAPGVGGAVAIEGGLEARWWRAGLAVQTTPRRFGRHPSDSAVRGRFDVLTAEAVGCVVPWAGPVEFPICGRIAAGGMRATGEGDVGQSEPAWGGWWGAGGSGAVAWHATDRWAPIASVQALAPLRDWSFSVGSVPGTLHRTGPIAVRAWVGLEIHL